MQMREWEDWDCEYSVIIPENAQQVTTPLGTLVSYSLGFRV